MKIDHLFKKVGLGASNILDGLARHRIGQKSDEIARMSRFEGDTDFAVCLKPADPGTMAGTGIDDNERSLRRIDLNAIRRDNLDQSVIDRPLQRAAIHDKLDLIVQNMRRCFRCVLAIRIAALSHNVTVQNAALCRIDHVFGGGAEHVEQRQATSILAIFAFSLHFIHLVDDIRGVDRHALRYVEDK